jgi:hypothetical protein
MELVGTNMDSSGHYAMYLDADEILVTINSRTRLGAGEEFRQELIPVSVPYVYDEEEWYDYSDNGHTAYFDMYGEGVILDGTSYKLGELL